MSFSGSAGHPGIATPGLTIALPARPTGWRERLFRRFLRRYVAGELARAAGRYEFEFFEDGSVPRDPVTGAWDFSKGRLRSRARISNKIPTVGLNYLIGVALASTAQITAWYAGLIDNSGFTSFADADTMASHGGWTEFTTYAEANRQAWTPAGSVAAGAVTNASVMVFTPSAGGTLKGGFLTSSSTRGGTTGTLYSEGPFDAGNQSVTNGTPFRVNATFSVTSAS